MRMVVLSISGRSGKVGTGSGKYQLAISRRAKSALPTTTKYLAMGTSDNSRELSNRGRPTAAMLDRTHVARQIDKGDALLSCLTYIHSISLLSSEQATRLSGPPTTP